MDEQLEAFAEHVAALTTAPGEVWEFVALPVAVAINALNAATGDDAAFAEPSDAPVVLARQLDAARRRHRLLNAPAPEFWALLGGIPQGPSRTQASGEVPPST